jgi:hypothetical protein
MTTYLRIGGESDTSGGQSDRWSEPFSKAIPHEPKILMVTIGSHSSKVIFNVISSSTNPIIIGLSWFILHNP